jgi:hypothetical protein
MIELDDILSSQSFGLTVYLDLYCFKMTPRILALTTMYLQTLVWACYPIKWSDNSQTTRHIWSRKSIDDFWTAP